MKRAILLTVVALFALGVYASADYVEVTLPAGQNLIAPPVVPFDPAPTAVFAGIPLTGNLYRFDAAQQSYVGYNPFLPHLYGGVLLGDGAWLNVTAGTTWGYDGAPNGLPDGAGQMTDMWISLPSAGATLVGHPFNHQVTIADMMVTDGTRTISWDEAVTEGWIAQTAYGWDPVQGSYIAVGTRPFPIHRSNVFQPFRGYFVDSTTDNLALIIPAQ